MTDAPQTFDVRPGELALRNVHATRQLVATQESVDVRGRGYLYGLEAGIVYLFPRRVGKALALEYHGVELVDVERGALPLTFPPQDAHEAQEWLRGYRLEPSFAERVEQMVKLHDLPDPVTGGAVVKLVDAGFDEGEAVRVTKEAYARTAAEQRLYRMNWGAWADSLIAARDRPMARAKEETPA